MTLERIIHQIQAQQREDGLAEFVNLIAGRTLNQDYYIANAWISSARRNQ